MKNYRNTDDMEEATEDISQLLAKVNELTGDISEVAEEITEEPEEIMEAADEPEEITEEADAVSDVPAPRKRGMLPPWAVAIINVLMTGVILVVFAFFHHVLPAMISQWEREQALLNAPETVPTEPVVTEPPTEALTEPPATEPPDLRTEWQKKFEEHFSDEIVWTENSYKSPNVSITVETISYGEGNKKQTYHVADIYIGSMENFTTYVAGGDGGYFNTQDVIEMSEATDALIAISGDFITYQRGGFLIRNGSVYAETTNNVSICALFPDGTMETYEDKEFSIEDIKNRGAIQVWSFGPTLLDENGDVRDKYNVPRAVSYPNPRSAIGYYEPGHYCFVVVDGRQNGYAKGMTIPELAQIFKDLGCTKAYNLDGGGSAVMTFNQKHYSKQSNGGRELGDILLIRESPEYLASLTPTEPAVSETTEPIVSETGVPATEEGIG